MEIVFQFITVVTAIVATLVEKPDRRTKVILVVLALGSGIASVVKAQQGARKEAFTSSALESVLMALPNPSDSFSNALMKSADDSAKKYQLDPQQTVIFNDNNMISKYSSSGSQQVDAIAVFTGEEVKQIWVNYLLGLANTGGNGASDQKRSQLILPRVIDPLVENAVFKDTSRRETEDEMSTFLNHVAIACRLVLEEEYGDPSTNWHVEVNGREPWVSVAFEEDRAKQVHLEKPFIQSIMRQRRPEAYAAAYREGKNQVAATRAESEIQRPAKQQSEQNLTSDRLTAYLRSKFPDRNQPDEESVQKLLADLAAKQCTRTRELDNLISQNWTWFLQREKSRPPVDHLNPSQTMQRFSAAGVVRTILRERPSGGHTSPRS